MIGDVKIFLNEKPLINFLYPSFLKTFKIKDCSG